MRLTPIFDTSALIELSRKDDAVLKRVRSRIPEHGCPLSHVAVLELFYGLRRAFGTDRIDDALKPLLLRTKAISNWPKQLSPTSRLRG